MALEPRDIQREGLLAGRLAELSEVVLSQSMALQQKDARIVELEESLRKTVPASSQP